MGCSNIGPEEIRKRRYLGWMMFLMAGIDFAVFERLHFHPLIHLILGVPLFFGFLGFFQADAQTCVLLVRQKIRKTDSGISEVKDEKELSALNVQARTIYRKTFLWSFLVTLGVILLGYFIP